MAKQAVLQACNGAFSVGNGAVEAGCEEKQVAWRKEKMKWIARIALFTVLGMAWGWYQGKKELEQLTVLKELNKSTMAAIEKGDQQQVAIFADQLLQTSEKVAKGNDIASMISLGNLARAYQVQGRYSEAESLYKEALALRKKIMGEDDVRTSAIVNNLAFLYYTQERYDEAEPLLKQVLHLREKELGKENSDTLGAINNLASLYVAQERYSEAEPLVKQIPHLMEKVLGKEHPDTIVSYNNLAIYYYAQERYNEAESIFKKMLPLFEKELGVDHWNTLTLINNLAVFYQKQNNYKKAESFFKQIIKLSEKNLGRNHPISLLIQTNYIVLLINSNRYDLVMSELQDQERRLLSRSFQELYNSSSEKMRRLYLQSISGFQHIVFSLVKQHPEKEYQKFAANVILRWKQFYAEESSVQHQLLNLSDDSETAELKAELATAQAKASQSLFNSQVKHNINEQIEQVNQAEASMLALMQQLKRKTNLEVKNVSLDRVLSALPQGRGLIEYRLFQPIDFKSGNVDEEYLLAVLVLHHNVTDGQYLFFLDKESTRKAFMQFALQEDEDVTQPPEIFSDIYKELDVEPELYAKMYKEVKQQLQLLNQEGLYESILGPFDDQIKNLKQLYIAPDGQLNLLSFASLRLPDGRFLAERQQINRLQTGRDLIENGKDFQRGKGLVAIGGAEYGRLPTGQTESTRKLAASYQQRAAQMLRAGVAPLENSGPEVQTIKRIFTNNISDDVQVFLGDNASEYNLKHLKHPPRILHLSTHGFYFAKEEQSRLADEAPLLLSGLALAGANNGLQGKLDKHGDDGLLYSLEVLGLNLQGTELVSLSACDTGKGVMDYSEGVYGLVRAFRTAGAENVLMTLTPVGDKSSREFMETFYNNWLVSKENFSPAQALHQTRLDFIHHKNPVYRDPAIWSPYVMVGK